MEIITTHIKKQGKGHDIYINGNLVTWVIGSVKNAGKELELLKKQYNGNSN